tara:strand:+ start:2933 stop:3379 length:447 start_codon:yes stop_codon:yes gene_type:complete
MTSTIEETIKEIAVKHGVSVGRNDPILILQTMQEKLIEKQNDAQQLLLDNFKSEIEQISSRWQNDAKEKSEQILNTTLLTCKETMAKAIQASTSESITQIKNVISSSLKEANALNLQAQKNNRFTIIASTAILFTSMSFAALAYIILY